MSRQNLKSDSKCAELKILAHNSQSSASKDDPRSISVLIGSPNTAWKSYSSAKYSTGNTIEIPNRKSINPVAGTIPFIELCGTYIVHVVIQLERESNLRRQIN